MAQTPPSSTNVQTITVEAGGDDVSWEDVVFSGSPDYDPNSSMSMLTSHGTGEYTAALNGTVNTDGLAEGASYNIDPPSTWVDDGTMRIEYRITWVSFPAVASRWWAALGVINNGGTMSGATVGVGVGVANSNTASGARISGSTITLTTTSFLTAVDATVGDKTEGAWLTNGAAAVGGTANDFGDVYAAYYYGSAPTKVLSRVHAQGDNNSTAIQFVAAFGTEGVAGACSARVRMQYRCVPRY